MILVDYGAGNLRSVEFGFSRAGAEPAISADPDEVRNARLAPQAEERLLSAL